MIEEFSSIPVEREQHDELQITNVEIEIQNLLMVFIGLLMMVVVPTKSLNSIWSLIISWHILKRESDINHSI